MERKMKCQRCQNSNRKKVSINKYHIFTQNQACTLLRVLSNSVVISTIGSRVRGQLQWSHGCPNCHSSQSTDEEAHSRDLKMYFSKCISENAFRCIQMQKFYICIFSQSMLWFIYHHKEPIWCSIQMHKLLWCVTA